MKIVGILKDKIIIEPTYEGDCETYVQLTQTGVEEIKNTFNIKEYASMEEFQADYFYEAEYLDNIRKGMENSRQKDDLSF